MSGEVIAFPVARALALLEAAYDAEVSALARLAVSGERVRYELEAARVERLRGAIAAARAWGAG